MKKINQEISKTSSNTATDAIAPKVDYAILPELLMSGSNPIRGVLEVRRPKKGEIVTIVGEATPVIPCLIDKVEKPGSKYKKEVFYRIAPAMQERLTGAFRPMQFHLAVNQPGTFFLWPQKLALLNGTTDSWTESTPAVVDAAKQGWVQVVSDLELGCYRAEPSDCTQTVPTKYPNIGEEVDEALGANSIGDEDHPIFNNPYFGNALTTGDDKGEGK
ncbi:MAG: hypothetical protein V7717_05325 [Porticoccaceae bacterium]